MPTQPPFEPPRCHTCRRRLKTEQARLRGYGSVCWAKRGLRRPDLPGGPNPPLWAGQDVPLFPECFPEVRDEAP